MAEWIQGVAAGTGAQGLAGDGGPATAALLNNPFDLAFDPAGSLVFSDTFNHRLCRIDARSGIITTVAGTGERGFSGDGGPATAALLNEPYGVVIDKAGTIYFADRLNKRVRAIDAAGTIATIGEFVEPNGLALNADHSALFVADVADHRVRLIDLATGAISTFAGTGEARHDGDGGPASRAAIFGARAVALSPDGGLYVMERQGSCIRKIVNGVIETVAGTGARGYDGDGGDARAAVFAAPKEMAVAPNGDIYVVDTENHAIRLIDAAAWTVTTIASGLARPHGAAIGPDDVVYVGDSEHHQIRTLTRAP